MLKNDSEIINKSFQKLWQGIIIYVSNQRAGWKDGGLWQWHHKSCKLDVGLLSNQWSINEAYCIRAGQGELRHHWIIDWAQSKDYTMSMCPNVRAKNTLSCFVRPLTCPLNRNDVFRIGQWVRPIFFNLGYLIGSGDICPQIKSIYFLVLLALKGAKKA